MSETPSPPKRKGKRHRHRWRPHAGQQRHGGTAARILRAQDELVHAVREIYAEMFGVQPGLAKPFSLDLSVKILPGASWALEAQPSLEEQLRASVREMATRAEVYQPGRVYCYRCDSALCPHSIPPGPSCVFGGYSSTGLPLWPDFPQLLLELKHPEIDLLYQPAPSGLLAACMDADLLRHRQLNVFGRQSKTYNILGQVIFGFVVMRRPLPGVGKERVAFSLQAVESRRLDGRPRLEFNIVGRLPGGEPALNMLEGPYQARIFDILVTAGQRVRCLMPATGSSASALAARDEAEIKSPVMEILRKLAGKLEKVGRQQGRRTAHAEDRRVNHRPTPNAREDALAAPDELVFWDERRRTLAVVGPRNRVHIFSPEGRHVTSIILEAEAVQSRVRRKRWTPPAGEHLQRFRAALANPPSSADAAPPKQPRKSTPTFR